MADDETRGGVPSWLVTFSDMMSLLLTFFIMLVSFSELKSEEKYQALVDGFQQQFGNYEAQPHGFPGKMRPRNSNLSKMASTQLIQRQSILQMEPQLQAMKGVSNSHAPIIPNKKIVVGTILYFQEDQIELNDSQKLLLRQQADGLRGRPQGVEIRGHTSDRPSQTGTHVRDNWDLSFERCRRVMQYLVEEQRIDPRTLRISASAANEPLPISAANTELQKDSRVELFLLDEVVRETNRN